MRIERRSINACASSNHHRARVRELSKDDEIGGSNVRRKQILCGKVSPPVVVAAHCGHNTTGLDLDRSYGDLGFNVGEVAPASFKALSRNRRSFPTVEAELKTDLDVEPGTSIFSIVLCDRLTKFRHWTQRSNYILLLSPNVSWKSISILLPTIIIIIILR